MAFESAQLAIEPLIAYARGNEEWPDTSARIARALRERFGRRLHWAGAFHRGLFSRFSVAGLRLLFRWEAGWRLAFAATR